MAHWRAADIYPIIVGSFVLWGAEKGCTTIPQPNHMHSKAPTPRRRQCVLRDASLDGALARCERMPNNRGLIRLVGLQKPLLPSPTTCIQHLSHPAAANAFLTDGTVDDHLLTIRSRSTNEFQILKTSYFLRTYPPE